MCLCIIQVGTALERTFYTPPTASPYAALKCLFTFAILGLFRPLSTAQSISSDLIGVWPLQRSDPRHTAILQSPVLSQEFGDEFLKMNTKLKGALEADHVVVDGSAEGSFSVRGWPWLPVQAVPSVVIPDSFNFLIDPNHERFGELVWDVPRVFEFEPRLLNPDLR